MCDFSLSVVLTITDFAPFLSTVTVDDILEVVGASKLRQWYQYHIRMVVLQQTENLRSNPDKRFISLGFGDSGNGLSRVDNL